MWGVVGKLGVHQWGGIEREAWISHIDCVHKLNHVQSVLWSSLEHTEVGSVSNCHKALVSNCHKALVCAREMPYLAESSFLCIPIVLIMDRVYFFAIAQ